VLWESAADGCACCAQTGIVKADASVSKANWRGNKLETLVGILMVWPHFVRGFSKSHLRGERWCQLALIECNAAAKGDALYDKTHIYLKNMQVFPQK
jgi:hypothetical protein